VNRDRCFLFTLFFTASRRVLYGKSDFAWDADSWISAYAKGDIGEHFSYAFTLSGELICVFRSPDNRYG
jgi:hypothetical protein